MASQQDSGLSPTAVADTGDRISRKPQDNSHIDDRDEKEGVVVPERQDAFGNEDHAEVKYKVLTWWQGGLLMVTETISLGILSLPKAVAGLGLVPAVIILLGMGAVTSFTGYVIGQYKLRHPFISSMADAGEALWGPVGREIVGAGQMLMLVFIMASHILTFTAAMNTITKHGTCSMVFGVVGMVVSCFLSTRRTLTKLTWQSLVSCTSVLIAVVVTMIAVGIQNPAATVKATVSTDLVQAFTAVANITISYASHNSFFTFIAELKNPRDFTKALALLQSIDITLYTVSAVVIYRYTGDSVTSPALGSAGPLISRITYGIALPTILIAGVMNGHIASKAVYLRIFGGTARIHKRDFIAVGSWVGISVALWAIAWIIASAIPVFNNLLSLVTSLFASWFTFVLPGIFWLSMNKNLYFQSPRKIVLSIVNVLAITIGLVLCFLGVYTSAKAIHDDPGSGSFSCASNV